MKKHLRNALFVFMLLVSAVAVLAVVKPAVAANVVKRLQGGYVFDAVQTLSGGLKIGATGTSISNSYRVCDSTSDAAAGPWSALGFVLSSSETLTVTGAAVGDACVVELGTAAVASNQAITLDQKCAVTAADTVKLYIANPFGTGVSSSGTITPKTGKRCVRTISP